jgi:PhnB protein
MNTKLNAYISFKDNAREAMEFYKSVFGGKLTMSTFDEGGMSEGDKGDNRIMHATLETDNGMTIMAADTPSSMEYHDGARISMSVNGEDETELTAYFEKLAAAGTVRMPLEKAPWGDTFGMLTDKFGVAWMINISAIKT